MKPQSPSCLESYINIIRELNGKRIAFIGDWHSNQRQNDMKPTVFGLGVDKLLSADCEIFVYDPVAMEKRRRIGDKVHYGDDMARSCRCRRLDDCHRMERISSSFMGCHQKANEFTGSFGAAEISMMPKSCRKMAAYIIV